MATPVEMLRDIAARQSALRTYLWLYEDLATEEQLEATRDRDRAWEAGNGARIVQRAHAAELLNPEPLPFAPCCGWCRARTRGDDR